MEPIQILEAIKEDIRFQFDGDPLMMRTMNLVITEYKARSERLHKHGVSGKRPYRCSNCHAELILDEVINNEITLRQAAGVPTRSEGKAGD
jgi:hypothetical protein